MKTDKSEETRSLLSFLLTGVVLVIVGFFIGKVPNVLDETSIQATYYLDMINFVAEKPERLQYMILTGLFPILYLLFFKATGLLKIDGNSPSLWDALGMAEILGLLIVAYVIALRNSAFVLISALGAAPILLYCCLPACFYLIWTYQLMKGALRKASDMVLHMIPISLILLLGYLFINPNFQQVGFLAYHADAYYYAVLKVSSGLTPGIDFNSLYGYYPYFYSTIMRLLGDFDNLYHFSMIVSSLFVVALFSLYRAVYLFIRNRAIACLTFVSMLFSILLYSYINYGAPYLRYTPHRVLFPALFLYWAAEYSRAETAGRRKVLQYVGFVLALLALLWNLDTGIVVLASLVLLLGYELLSTASILSLSTLRSIVRTLVMAVGAVFLFYAILAAISFARTGTLIRPSNLITSQALFYGAGFGMIRMQLVHPWVLLVLLYGFGLARALRNGFFRCKDEAFDRKGTLPFFVLPILGMGLFSYYQGRSHDAVFVAVTYVGMFLLGVYADYFANPVLAPADRDGHAGIQWKMKKYVSLALLCALSLTSVFTMIYNKSLWSYWDKESLRNTSILASRLDFVREMNNDGLIPMDYLLGMDSYFYEAFGEKDTKPFPASIDLFTYHDYDSIAEYMKVTDRSIVLDQAIYVKMQNYLGDSWTDLLARFIKIETGDMVFCYLMEGGIDIGKDFVVALGKGTGGQEESGTDTWSWCAAEADISFYNFTQKNLEITYTFVAMTFSDSVFPLRVSFDGNVETYDIGSSGTCIEKRITLLPGNNSIHFSTTAPRIVTSNDPRDMHFRIMNLKVTE